MAYRTENLGSIVDTRSDARGRSSGVIRRTRAEHDAIVGHYEQRGERYPGLPSGMRLEIVDDPHPRTDSRGASHDGIEREWDRIGPLQRGQPIRRSDARLPRPSREQLEPFNRRAAQGGLDTPLDYTQREREAFRGATREKDYDDGEPTPAELQGTIEEARAKMIDNQKHAWKDSKKRDSTQKRIEDARAARELQRQNVERNLRGTGNGEKAIRTVNRGIFPGDDR